MTSVFVGAPAQGGPARGGQQISLRTRGGQPPLGPEKVDFGALALRARGGRQGGPADFPQNQGVPAPLAPPAQKVSEVQSLYRGLEGNLWKKIVIFGKKY